ncbi:hypothetical protein DL96DRAFT_1610139 [Flagelloscypha sp. PMI_526]|nr:hypothetical protein DL96DRAFT_1610139 [Flagelloscypha sp. PMI_526]
MYWCCQFVRAFGLFSADIPAPGTLFLFCWYPRFFPSANFPTLSNSISLIFLTPFCHVLSVVRTCDPRI